MKRLLFFLLTFVTFTFALAIISPKSTYAAVGCGFSPTSVAVGSSVGIIVTDLPGINVAKLYPFGGSIITLGNINGGTGGAGGNTFTIPTTATAPAYQVRVQTSFGGEITCDDGSGGSNLTITGGGGGTYTVWAVVPGCTSGLTCFKGVATGLTGTTYTFNSSNSTITKNTNYSVTVCAGDCATDPPLAGWPKTCQASDSTTLVVDWGTNTCTGISQIPAGCLKADVNGDGKVDVNDVQTVAFLVDKPAQYDPKYDFNTDGKIDNADWNFVNGCLTNTGAPYTGTGGAGCEGGFLACMAGIATDVQTKGGFSEQGLVGNIFSSILPIIIGLGGFLTVILIVVSGIQFVTSSGNPEAAAAARGRLTFAIIGFALLVLAFAITQIVDNVFLRRSGIF